MTWRDVAAARGYTDLGGRRWLAPDRRTVVPEGFVAAYCRPEVAEVEEMALGLPTPCQRPLAEEARTGPDGHPARTHRHAVHRSGTVWHRVRHVRDVEAGSSNLPSPTQVRLRRRQRMTADGGEAG